MIRGLLLCIGFLLIAFETQAAECRVRGSGVPTSPSGSFAYVYYDARSPSTCIGDTRLENAKVTTPPPVGRVRLFPGKIEYVPRKGYVGRDVFIVSGTIGGRLGRVKVSVEGNDRDPNQPREPWLGKCDLTTKELGCKPRQ